MRISVVGDNETCKALKGNLEHAGYVLDDLFPSFTIVIEERELTEILLDIADTRFGRIAAMQIGSISPTGHITLKVKDGNQNDRKLIISVPVSSEFRSAVELGVVRALDLNKTTLTSKVATINDLKLFDAGELLQNVVKVINEHIDNSLVPILDSIVNSKTATLDATLELNNDIIVLNKEFTTLSDMITSDTPNEVLEGNLKNFIIESIESSNSLYTIKLFDELMKYYTHKRWYQFWK